MYGAEGTQTVENMYILGAEDNRTFGNTYMLGTEGAQMCRTYGYVGVPKAPKPYNTCSLDAEGVQTLAICAVPP